MKQKITEIIIAIGILLMGFLFAGIPNATGSSQIITLGKQEVQEETDIAVEYVYTNELVTPFYHLYGNYLDDFVDITLKNGNSYSVTVVVETEIEGYTSRAAETIRLEANEEYTFSQNPRLLAESIDRLFSKKPGNFHIRVTQVAPGQSALIVDDTQEIELYSRRDFVWLPGDTFAEMTKLYAVWVTPTDPAVEALIRAAADFIESRSIVNGYPENVENDDNGSVWRRLEAIWEAESQIYNLTYVSTDMTLSPNSVQRIRLPSEVLDQASGNCIDLVLLYASAAEAMGLESAVIRLPGHAILAVRTDLVNSIYYFIETTLIGQATFAEATASGYQTWEEINGYFGAEADADDFYSWITVQQAWSEGILPIPWN